MISSAFGSFRSLSERRIVGALHAVVGPQHLGAVRQLRGLERLLAGMRLANDAWPGVCQSCVTHDVLEAGASLLIIGTISSPPFTGSVPPSTKQFCTSTTISAPLHRA